MYWLLLLLCLSSLPCFLFPLTSLAAETPSEWEPNFYYEDLEGLTDDELLTGIYSEVLEISDSLTGPAATPSEYSDAVADTSGTSDGEALVVYPDALDAMSLADDVADDYANCVRYDVSFNGSEYILLFNPEDIDSLYVDSQNRLWNMSGSTIQGRPVDAQFNPLQDEGMIFYLEPCLGNNFSSIHNGEYPNYARNYYWIGGSYDRLQYSTTYGIITVNDYSYPFYTSQTLDYALLIVIGGVYILLCLRNYRRY